MTENNVGTMDFKYEYKLKTCPITEEQATELLEWLGIDKLDAQTYSWISNARAILIAASKDYNKQLYRTEYRSIQERQ